MSNTITQNIQEVKKIPRMRLAQECFDMIHQEDPNSRVSLRYIRQLSKSGNIPTVRAGNRILINYDALLEYLSNPVSLSPANEYGTIRPVSENVRY